MYKYNIHEDGITKVTAGGRLHTCNGLQFFLSTSNIAYEISIRKYFILLQKGRSGEKLIKQRSTVYATDFFKM